MLISETGLIPKIQGNVLMTFQLISFLQIRKVKIYVQNVWCKCLLGMKLILNTGHGKMLI
jgi:hypothetical protein